MIPRHLKIPIAFVFLAAMLLGGALARGATFHVSPFGSSTPPYDTYAKAATDPRTAIEAASGVGDTVLIHAGQYDVDTTIDIPRGLELIGVGADSAHLVSRGFFEFETLLKLRGDNMIGYLALENGRFAGSPTVQIWAESPGNIEIHHCHIVQLQCYGTPSGTLSYHDNLHEVGNGLGIETSAPAAPGSVTRIFRNRFFRDQFGSGATCIVVFGGQVLVYENIFDLSDRNDAGMSFEVLESSSSVLDARNNLILGGQFAFSWIFHSGSIENNTIVGTGLPIRVVLDARPNPRTVTIRNNTFVDCLSTPFFTSCEDCDPGATIVYVHNAFWPPADSLWRPGLDMQKLSLTDSANFVAYPMFTSDSSFHLQYGSPLIDAGDPTILDADDSRSDIGWTGGPGGITYSYLDEPPLPPDSIKVTGEVRALEVSWSRRSEGDLAGYHLYRGLASGFWHPGLAAVAKLSRTDTTWAETLSITFDSAFYVVSAFDSSGQESNPSPEARYLVGDHTANRPPVLTPLSEQDVSVGDTLKVPISASDPDGESITLSVVNLPPVNALFIDSGGGRGVLTFMPDTSQIGNHFVDFVASDGRLADTAELVIHVHDRPVNHPPVITEIAEQNVDIGDTLIIPISAADPDGDSITLSVVNLPPVNAVFIDSGGGRGVLTFMPDTSQIGDHFVEFVASDGRLADTLGVTIHVRDTAQVAVLTGIVKVYPNPMNGSGSVEVYIPGQPGTAHIVKLVLHDLLGRTVATCYDGSLTSGVHTIALDRSESGIGLKIATGVYYLRLQDQSGTIGKIYKIAVVP